METGSQRTDSTAPALAQHNATIPDITAVLLGSSYIVWSFGATVKRNSLAQSAADESTPECISVRGAWNQPARRAAEGPWTIGPSVSIAPHQSAITPPSFFVITTVADRGRPLAVPVWL